MPTAVPQPKLTAPNSGSSALATAISSATGAGGSAFDDGANGSGFDLPEAEANERRAEKKRRQSVSHTEKQVVTVGASSASRTLRAGFAAWLS